MILQNSPTGVGIEGDFSLGFRILSLLTVPVMLVISAIYGRRTGKISDKFGLIVTPPGPFFAIWGVIYIALIVAGVYNTIANVWSIEVVSLFGVGCLLNAFWVFVFDYGSIGAINFCTFVVIVMAALNETQWALMELPNGVEDSVGSWNIANRNIFAFYQGWLVGASNLNIGVTLVHYFQLNKTKHAFFFWIVAPLTIIAMVVLNLTFKEGFVNNIAMYLSAGYALVGAAISTKRRYGVEAKAESNQLSDKNK